MPYQTFEHTLLHTLADNVPHRIYAKDTAGRFTFANRAVAIGMGASDPEELLGKTDFDFYAPDAAQQYFDEERQVLSSGQPMLDHEEHVFYSRSGKEAWLMTTKVPLRDEAGRIIGLVGINYEITERKAAEEALRAAKLLAEQATRAKTEFLAAMSHELRTPLNAVLGYAALLQRESSLGDKQRAALHTIEQGGKHLLLLINELLDLAKIERGNVDLTPADVYLPDLAQTVAGLMRVKATEKRLSLGCELDPSLPPIVVADGRRLSQVLLNLLGNAIKFTDAGGVVLRVRCVDLTASQARIRFEVEDTGVGLAQEDLRRIFEPYEQACDAAHRAEGTGLGLAICQQLVQAMGGTVEVRSKRGLGSAFSFTLALPVRAVWSSS
ncbi:MAG: PAS domain S-box protein [Betaproteobacteria bacterium]|nr:MAG: PAS domain S-box protein [Betaproteobacteria bacterium]